MVIFTWKLVLTVCSSKMVKVYFRNFTFKKPEDEKNCFKKEKPESLAEGNFQKPTSRRKFPEANFKKEISRGELQKGTPRKELQERNSKKGTSRKEFQERNSQ